MATDITEQSTSQEQPAASLVITNDPNAQAAPTSPDSMRAEIEEQLKMELLKELSLDDVRQMVGFIRSGVMLGQDSPNTFDEYGRNFARMVRRVKRMAPGGTEYWEERSIVRTLAEAVKERKDFFDPILKIWIREGRKRETDYPENTVEFWQKKSDDIESAIGAGN